ncbi:hypothetical protein [Mucilaginibacter sp.]|uniref:hypothetical protein n=1 Tax=Mucilaginibacter sp. TaxID=1882438 RepID=UPI0035BBE86F
MILTSSEMQWVSDRMKVYDIKYQEIYYEILDHIITAIELKRTGGDTREIAIVFQDVVDTDFWGYAGIESLALQQEKIYRKYVGSKSSKMLRSNLLDWRIWLITVVLSALAYQLPNNRFTHIVFLSAIFLLAFTPLVYSYALTSRNVKTIKKKRSLLKAHVISHTYLPAMLLNSIIYLPTFFTGLADGDNGFKLMAHWPMPALMVVLMFFTVLNYSFISLCRQMLRKA